jgi:hypothetical protein
MARVDRPFVTVGTGNDLGKGLVVLVRVKPALSRRELLDQLHGPDTDRDLGGIRKVPNSGLNGPELR